MPYITEQRKQELVFCRPATVGDLTYLLAKAGLDRASVNDLYDICVAYLEDHIDNYVTRCEVIGSLECARREFRRRWWPAMAMERLERCEERFYGINVGPYEDTKIKQNGDLT